MNKILCNVLKAVTVLLISNMSFSQYHPVVISDSITSCLHGSTPSDIVAFRHETGNWIQIPVQIDERVMLDFAEPYGPNQSVPWLNSYPYPSGVDYLFYADTNTYVGADTNTLLDADDEVVVMWNDLGDKTTLSSSPAGTVSGSCCEVKIVSPLNNLDTSYLYLYLNNGSLVQDAGVDYVTYNFNLVNGPYPDSFNFSGYNPEQSIITTDEYEVEFSDRWITEVTKIKKGTNPLNISDRHQNFFSPGVCGRTEQTFSSQEGAFVCNIDGCIRAIRSYMGANSGPLTQRTNKFYAQKQEVETHLRVHNIPSVYDVMDYDSNAFGMMNYSNLNPSGILIDGVTDNGINDSAGILKWELITGSNIGSLGVISLIEGTFQDSVDGSIGYYWEDNTSSPVSKCTGDKKPIGTSGIKIVFNTGICTDVKSGCYTSASYRSLSAMRHIFYDTSALTVNQVKQMDSVVREGFIFSNGNCTANTATIKELNKNKFLLYPNPANDFVIIKGDEIKAEKIEIYNSYGQCVYVKQNKPQALIKVDISTLSKGIYFVRVNNNNVYKLHKNK